MTYWYEELLTQLKLADMSPWTNKWNEVFDFTAHRTADDGTPNWRNSSNLNWKLIAPLGEVTEKMEKVQAFKGADAVKSLYDIEEADLESITLEFDEEETNCFFDVGPYFNDYARNMIKGVVPCAQFKGQTQDYMHTCLLVAFVEGNDGLFDSTRAMMEHDSSMPCDLSSTLQYKLLITCGTFVKTNKKTKKQVVWVEETRSVELDLSQKQEIC